MTRKLIVSTLVSASLLVSFLVVSAQDDLPATQGAIQTQIADLEATLTAIAPTEASGVTEGWARYEGVGVAVMLPDTFSIVDLDTLGDLIDAAEGVAPELESLFDLMRENPDLYLLYAMDSNIRSPNFSENVNIVGTPMPFALDIDFILDSSISMLESAVNGEVSSKVIDFDGEEVGRLVVEFAAGGFLLKQVQYFFLRDDMIYVITYGTTPANFDARAHIYEESARTFEVLEEGD
jgi:hypothetical protein